MNISRATNEDFKLKVMHVITGLNTGGAETMLLKIVKYSEGRPERHIVVSMMDEGTRGKEIRRQAALYSLNLKRGQASLRALFRLILIIRSERPDILQGWMYHANLLLTLAKFFYPKPIFWNIRQTLASLYHEKLLTRVVITISRWFSSFISVRIIYNSYVSVRQHEKFGFKPVSVVIANGFDLVKYHVPNTIDRKRARVTFGLPADAIVLGQVARFHPMKNHLGFVAALASFLTADPRLYVLMAGPGVDEQNKDLMAAFNKYKIALGRVRLLGEQDNLVSIYHSLDFLVNPSSWGEAFPNVVGEAMSCGVPCIVSDVGDSAHIVGCSGFVFNPNDQKHLSFVLRQALELNRMQYRQRSNAARHRIETSYAISSIYGQYIALYKEAVR